MLFRKYVDARHNAGQEIRFLRWLALLLGVIILVQYFFTARLLSSQRIVLVPPEIRRSLWVSDAAVSREYLEEMAYWYAGLALNIAPAVADYQNGLFLKYAAPSEYGRLQAEMGARAEFLRKNNTATQFVVRSITADEKTLRVALAGTLYTWMSDKKAGERNTVYVVGFKYMNGRLYVSEFRETSEQNPFGDRPVGGA